MPSAKVFPVMLTPFHGDRSIDYAALEKLIAWYEEKGVDGLFAVCQSSEMFFLSLEERVALAKFVKEHAHVPVVASGHIADALDGQAYELAAMADTGVDAMILLTNRFCGQFDGSDAWLAAFDKLLAKLPDVPLGLYECPYPYKWVLSDKELAYAASTGRFRFLKDTCCDARRIRGRLEILRGTGLELYNANTATLLDSVRAGAAGYSGVMANIHPELYKKLLAAPDAPGAELLQAQLTMCALIERQCYPVNAKYYLEGEGVPMTRICRTRDAHELTETYRSEMEQLRLLTADLNRRF
ncbi:MAG: dihydrodipicolinate synthase family protein [Clostridiaceae bacterium]|nr:dihydrodipicolinate synthase family protein [Clostridiaceae bacterium]